MNLSELSYYEGDNMFIERENMIRAKYLTFEEIELLSNLKKHLAKKIS